MSVNKNYIQGRTFYVLFSDDDWTTTYTAVCLSKQGLNRERPVTKQNSQCGVAKSYGPVDRNMDFECINNTTPDAVSAGVGEASYKKFATWFEANTALKVKRMDPSDTGVNLYFEADCRLSKLSDSADSETNMTFSFSVEIEGDPVETP